MTDPAPDTRSVVIERDIAQPPEKVWRALTQPHLLGEWLMASDFQPVVGHAFQFTAGWGSVACRVIAMETGRMVSYSWDSMGLASVVTWTLMPVGDTTRLRMEQSGFRPDQAPAFHGAQAGWPRFLAALEALLARGE